MLIRATVLLSLLLATTAASATAATGITPATTSPATAAAATKLPSDPAPVLGTDYFVIDSPKTESGKAISVVEVFGYSCPHCAHFQPYLDAWKKKQRADVKFSYLPAVFGGIWDAFARAYYTAEAMGVLQKTHNGIFNAVHVQHRIPNNLEDIAALYADYGVDKEAFASTMLSAPISAKVDAARALAQGWGVDGTPTIVVAGKYRVMITRAGGAKGLLRNVDWFIAKERTERNRH